MEEDVLILDFQSLNFSNNFSEKRTKLAKNILGANTINRLLWFSLYLMGASRATIAALTNKSSETIKSSINRILQHGLIALNDRRLSDNHTSIPLKITSKDNCKITVDSNIEKTIIDISGNSVSIPTQNPLQLKIFLLTLMNSGIISCREVSKILNYSPGHIKLISKNLDDNDAYALIDQRKGQEEFRFTPEVKSELILQFILDLAKDGKTSSELISNHINERTDWALSSRSVRFHLERLGLGKIKKQVSSCLEDLKKNSTKS